MAHHDLKLSAEFFDASERGDKPFEVRLNDRGYAVGDTLRMREVSGPVNRAKLTGRVGKLWAVSFILPLSPANVRLVVLGLREVIE